LSRVAKRFYVSPSVLIGANSAILLTLGIPFFRDRYAFWDGVSLTIGAFLLLFFFVLVWTSHRSKQSWEKQNRTGWIRHGLYSAIRHPDYSGIIMMNLAFLFIFRTFWLLPVSLFFIWLWSRQARYEEELLLAKYGDSYVSYIGSTGRFFPKFRKE